MEGDRFKHLIRAVVPRTMRNWLRSPSKSAEWLWKSAKFSLGMTQSLEIAPNWPVLCHPYAYKVYRESQIVDPEQSLEFRNFLSYCSNTMLLYDIGAHFGIFSLAAAHFGGKAVAVDPSPTAAKMIAVQAVLNGCSESILTLCYAASGSSGQMEMLSSGVYSYGYFKMASGRPKNDLTRTPAVTIDQLARQYGVPTHIKIDVEGHEAAVLAGAEDTLSRHVPILFLELHNEMVASEGRDPGAALDVLSRAGYAAFALNGEPIEKGAILDRPIIRIVARHV